jgi:predicted Rossmann fold nucleotide-binding protein DprA/Smf involved in DNA uptake
MKIAVVGSRTLSVLNLEEYLPRECTEIVSGGARGIDSCAANFAKKKGLRLTEFLPDYSSFGKAAPLIRNKEIVNYADVVFVFWDGVSRGSRFVIDYAKKIGKPCRIFLAK